MATRSGILRIVWSDTRMRSNPSLRQVLQNALKRLEDSPQFASKPDAVELRRWLLIVLADLREEERQAHLYEVA